MTIIGLLVALIMLCTGHRPHVFGYGFYFVVGKHWGGCELGAVFLVNKSPSLALLQHEAGHGVQNTIFGVLMPFIVCIPSAVRYWWRRWYEARGYHHTKAPLPPYDSIWFEGQATRIGTRLFPDR